ncbi:hypothetical protein [Pseudomonas sp. RIT-PI-o]|uniref:hypothetical protein n=1 Tax=Pseudomonas sp. RIT-PI-o TaxID=1690246 RepID=UPI0006CD7035|nr:hypothetical protein [Pseudomonas sp. RIT-PI-o]KPG82229.1 hypothetical protein AEQ63_13585 [Pseudomonas sp. RIT-PI-o]
MANPFKHHLRLKRPCTNCPFLKQGAIELAPGRLDGIIAGLIEDDHSTFQCHKTVHSARGGEWDDDGNYAPSGHESMCAGAAAYLLKHKRPTVGMRIAFAMGAASPTDWDDAQAMTIE